MHFISKKGFILGLALFSLLATACLEDPGPELPSLQETLQNDPQYAQMVETLQASQLWEELDGSVFVTIFSPTNAAFDSFLVANNLDKIGDLSDDSLNNLISYHLQYGKVFETDFISSYLTTPAAGPGNAPVVFLMELGSSGAVINSTTKVLSTDVEADDGVVHTIDEVMYPPNVMEILETNPLFSDFVEVINKAGLRDEIAETKPLTLFAAPNTVWDEFFNDQPVGTDDVDDLSIERCRELVQYHLLTDQFRFEDLAGNVLPVAYETWLDDESIKIIEASGLLVNDSVRPLLLDVQGTNGVIHFMRDVLEFE